MPQFNDPDKFDQFCLDFGCKKIACNPKILKTYQCEINYSKVISISLRDGISFNSVLISSDNRIIDGNHRIAAAIYLNMDNVELIQVPYTFDDLINNQSIWNYTSESNHFT